MINQYYLSKLNHLLSIDSNVSYTTVASFKLSFFYQLQPIFTSINGNVNYCEQTFEANDNEMFEIKVPKVI